MKIAIFDIDGCISDDSWRLSLINWKASDPDERYDPYHSVCGNDPPANQEVARVWMEEADRIVFMTSRPVKYRSATETWLKAAFPILNAKKCSLFMRDSQDSKSSCELKRVHLDRLMSYGAILDRDVIVAFDDRIDVVEMYKQAGIKNAQLLSIHSEGVYTPPPGAAPLGGQRPAQLLRSAAKTFELRNVQYGNAYKRFGQLLIALFPGDSVPACRTAEEATRLDLIVKCLGKLQRYAHNFSNGGHQDSARDLQVYAAMLEEHTVERPR